MNSKHNQNSITKLTGAIAATAFLGVSAILPGSAFAQSSQSPGAYGNPQISEPNTNSQINDPSRPLNEQNRPTALPNAGSESGVSGDRMQSNDQMMNNTGVGGGAGGAGSAGSVEGADGSRPEQPANRIEKYTQPGATDPSRSTEYLPPANSPSNSNSNGRMNDQMINNSGSGSGSGGTSDRGNDRFTSPSNSTPGAGTYTTPSTQINRTSGPNSGTTPNQINNDSTSPSATPSSGSTNYNSGGSNTGGGTGGSGSVPGLW